MTFYTMTLAVEALMDKHAKFKLRQEVDPKLTAHVLKVSYFEISLMYIQCTLRNEFESTYISILLLVCFAVM